MPEISQQAKIQHLYLRAGFGASPQEVRAALNKKLPELVKALFAESRRDVPLERITAEEPGYNRKAIKELIAGKDSLSPEEKKRMVRDLIVENRGKIGDLNFEWIARMGEGREAMREKMTLFWHGHFACRSLNPKFVQTQNNLIRELALGKFGDLLLAVSQDAAMLQFLNNQQNKKTSPNENFAREVMELFTLGRGNYTEHDVKEAARAFTGWGFAPLTGEYVFRPFQHDAGPKTIFGKTGNFGGEEVLDLILARPETAPFLVRKIYRFFVNDTPDEARVNDLAWQFRRSDYDIAGLLEAIFTADWFYKPQNVGVKIKSPVELLATLQRQLGVDFGGKQSLLFVQKALGQVLFYPPNVAGWAGGRAWIDSSSLLLRMKLPELVFRGAEINVQAKDDGDVNTEHLAKKGGKFLTTTMDWPAFEAAFAGLTGGALLDALSAALLQRPLAPAQRELLLKRAGNQPIKNLVLALTTLPEYQLC